MKTLKFSLLSVAILLCVVSANSQTANDIISKYIEATGGKAVIAGINSLYLESITEVMGNESPTTTIILNGKGYKNVSEMGDQKMIQCYTDKGGWGINPMSGGTAEAMPEEQYKAGVRQIDIGGPLVDYAAKGNKLELLGTENIDSVNAFKLKLTDKNNL